MPTEPRTSWIDYALVVPDAQTRGFDWEYQLKLYVDFHTHWLARSLHAICTPLVVWALFVLTASWSITLPWLPLPALNHGFNLAGVAAVVLMAAYARMDRLMALWMAPLIVANWLTASLFADAGGGTAQLYAWLLLGVASVTQSLSHYHEPIPRPWGTGEDQFWVWWAENPIGMRIAVLAAYPLFALLELVSSPRIYPLGLVCMARWLRPTQALAFQVEAPAPQTAIDGSAADAVGAIPTAAGFTARQ